MNGFFTLILVIITVLNDVDDNDANCVLRGKCLVPSSAYILEFWNNISCLAYVLRSVDPIADLDIFCCAQGEITGTASYLKFFGKNSRSI